MLFFPSPPGDFPSYSKTIRSICTSWLFLTVAMATAAVRVVCFWCVFADRGCPGGCLEQLISTFHAGRCVWKMDLLLGSPHQEVRGRTEVSRVGAGAVRRTEALHQPLRCLLQPDAAVNPPVLRLWRQNGREPQTLETHFHFCTIVQK